ncbi:MAG TPA: hypothetical protein VD969_17980 [Symbiobacteriaceae bacterium]|nr:hypothetical protein [Symbiobacteriaceae bacterium]
MGTGKRKPETPTRVILGVLVSEFQPEERSKSDATIRRRLRYHRLGPYDQDQVEVVRRFKDALQREIGLLHRSQYYLGPHGKFAAPEDFDVARMVSDYRAAFPEIGKPDIEWFIPWALYVYYLR